MCIYDTCIFVNVLGFKNDLGWRKRGLASPCGSLTNSENADAWRSDDPLVCVERPVRPIQRICLLGFGEVGRTLAEDLGKLSRLQLTAFDLLFAEKES